MESFCARALWQTQADTWHETSASHRAVPPSARLGAKSRSSRRHHLMWPWEEPGPRVHSQGGEVPSGSGSGHNVMAKGK